MPKVTYNSNLNDITFVAFDVETTGLSPVANRLVELSGVKFSYDNGKVETFSELIDPEMPIPREVTNIHGITDRMVRGKPNAAAVIPKFLSFIGADSVLIAHNAPFDLEFMRVNIARLGLVCPENYVVDTLVLSREVLPEAPRHQLKTVVEMLELPSGGYHRALADSEHVKEVFRLLTARSHFPCFENLCAIGAVTTFNFDQFAEQVADALPEAAKKTMEKIQKAIDSKLVVEITYNGAVVSRRKVQPISLIHSRGQIYLTAFCKMARAERTFRIDRIESLSGC
ncbi:MAG: WYL domain-containing protein [Candidatus Obscuribacterales bacterium]|nr:WYL domain-containing protein [Candidatus Obscuribacterales bacterium]